MSRAAAEYALPPTGDPGLRQPEALPGLARLSARERELVTLVAQGATDAQIADLTRLALAAGLIQPEEYGRVRISALR